MVGVQQRREVSRTGIRGEPGLPGFSLEDHRLAVVNRSRVFPCGGRDDGEALEIAVGRSQPSERQWFLRDVQQVRLLLATLERLPLEVSSRRDERPLELPRRVRVRTVNGVNSLLLLICTQ